VNFEPKPPNDFEDFYREYYRRCSERVPAIRAIAAKWKFEDLIPGLSDFDTRFILEDPMSVGDWNAMSLAVGRVHTELARENPKWARNLEHLPGVNFTVSEIMDPRLFFPESQQWTFYKGDAEVIARVESSLSDHQWTKRDELFQLSKFSTFCGPYMRGIDPPLNIGPWEDKYPLHSRYMHYFAPPVQAGVSLVEKRNVPGKLEALEMARERFPHPEVIDSILDAVDRHYEISGDYEEERLREIESELEEYLQTLWGALDRHLTLVNTESSDTRAAIQEKVRAVSIDPMGAFFQGVKFGRLMKGRLLFYAEEIPWFESEFLIRHEIRRILPNLFATPLTIYGKVRYGEDLTPEEVIDRLRGNLLDAAVCNGLLTFAARAREPIEDGQEKAQARRVAEKFDAVLEMAETLSIDMLESAD